MHLSNRSLLTRHWGCCNTTTWALVSVGEIFVTSFLGLLSVVSISACCDIDGQTPWWLSLHPDYCTPQWHHFLAHTMPFDASICSTTAMPKLQRVNHFQASLLIVCSFRHFGTLIKVLCAATLWALISTSIAHESCRHESSFDVNSTSF